MKPSFWVPYGCAPTVTMFTRVNAHAAPGSGLEDAELRGLVQGLGAGACAQLAVGRTHLCLDRVMRDVQLRGDFA